MSKASEWAESVKAARAAQPQSLRMQWPRFLGSNDNYYLTAQVEEEHGHAVIAAAGKVIEVPVHLAGALGRWLLDTFGEKP